MTMARSRLVNPSVTRWYHCMTRCVRGADLLAKVPEDRKAWIEQRLQELAQIFAVGVGFRLAASSSWGALSRGPTDWLFCSLGALRPFRCPTSG